MQNKAIQFILKWVMIGIIVGAAILYYQGYISFHFNGSSSQLALIGKGRDSFADAVNMTAPAVVSLQVESIVEVPIQDSERKELEQIFGKHLPNLTQAKPLSSSGSGVIINTDGYVITNHHVIAKAERISVILNDGRSAVAEMVGTDPDTDIAVLKIALDNLPEVKIADINTLNIGDVVLAIGYPFRIGQTVTQGIISATGRSQVSQNTYENFLQTDAAINPGNSGGALINTRGEIIGINSLIYTESGNFAGIGFAIPINLVTDVMQQIIKNGYVIRGWLGVEGQSVSPQMLSSIGIENTKGVLITGVDIGGPGQKAGLLPGDIITHVNNKEIVGTTDILDMIAAGRPGDQLRIDGLRQRQSFTAVATLGQRPLMSQ
jgi:serine protease DegS